MKLSNRHALGVKEIISIARCILHYKRIGMDPGYDDYFEKKYTDAFVEFMGGEGYADAVSSGCASLYIALKALKLPSTSLIATSPVTDASGISVITEQEHIPYLIDSQEGSYNISVETLKERYIPGIRALILTHAGGEPCEMKDIMHFCQSKSIKVIEDCSQAVGAVPRKSKHKVGTYGDISCFSTMYRKTLSASGSSGLIFTKNLDTYRLIKQLADRGKRWWDKDFENFRDPGHADFPALNWNSDELRCAIGLANLKRLDKAISARKLFLKKLIYRMEKEDICLFTATNFQDGFSPFYFPIRVEKTLCKASVVEISNELKARGVGVGVNYGCLVRSWEWAHPFMYDDYNSPNAFEARDNCFHLYLNEKYSKRELEFIVQNFKDVEDKHLILDET